MQSDTHKAYKVTRDQLIYDIKSTLFTKKPLHIVGQPGGGKTQIVENFGQEHSNVAVFSLNCSQWDTVDLRGLPHILEGNTSWGRPDAFIKIDELAKNNEYVIVFMDEFPKAPISAEGSFYQMLQMNRVAGHELPENVRWVLAGNGTDDGGFADKPANPVQINRGNVIVYDGPTFQEWSEWAADKIHPLVLGYLSQSADLCAYDAKAFCSPTPRAWETASENIKAFEEINGREITAKDISDVEREVRKAVGHKAASNMQIQLRLYPNLAKLSAILKNPNKAKLPSKTESAAHYIQAIRCSQWLNDETVEAICQYIERFTLVDMQQTFIAMLAYSGKLHLVLDNETMRDLVLTASSKVRGFADG